MTTFRRTAVFCKEDGLRRRLPYELIVFEGHPFFSFVPGPPSWADVDINTVIMDTPDYEYDDNVIRPEFDKITNEVNVDSETVFLALTEHVTGYYDLSPSAEFGYPRQ